MTELDKDGLEAAIAEIPDGSSARTRRQVAVDVIRAYLDAADEWRPIETAPKDGTDVLVSRRDDDGEGEFAVAQWWVHAWAFMSGRPGDMPALLGFIPTHWRPLPSPPKEG